MNFEVLILGSDVNAYYMARCTHEKYGKKAYLLASKKMAFTAYSTILNIIYDSKIWEENYFLEALDRFAEMHKEKKILLISSNETYAEFIVKNKDKINKQYVYNYPSLNIVEALIDKEKFYKTYENSILDFPKTIFYNGEKLNKENFGLMFPVIVKPADVVSYNHLEFDGKNKIYKIDNFDDLAKILKQITDGGYKKTIIIQEYIPGDDSYLFDAVVYSNKEAKVKLMSFAQIGLQEHTKHMIGNAAVLINGYNSYGGNVEEMSQNIKQFMENIKYQGFAEFDLKYDSRDNKFKVLEINARQGRSSYYLIGLGYNLVETLVNDLILDQNMDYKFLNQEVMLSFVPKYVIKHYIKNKEFKKRALKLWNKKLVIKPLFYNKERNLKRKIILYKKQLDYIRDYKTGYWENN